MAHTSPEARREYERQWRLRNPESERRKKLRYYEKKKAQIFAQQKRYVAEHGFANRLRRQYGITEEEFYKFLSAQGDGCAICSTPVDKATAVVDHCHRTGRVRGILCRRCNSGIGLLGDSLEALTRAVDYLRGSE